MLQRIDLRAGLGSLRGVLPRAAVDIGGAVASAGVGTYLLLSAPATDEHSSRAIQLLGVGARGRF